MSPWSYFFSALALLTIMLCCMFPLAPHPVKLAAVYCSMTLIICILCTLTVRSLLALSSWVVLGRSLWLFPHLLSDVRAPAPSTPHLPVHFTCFGLKITPFLCCVQLCLVVAATSEAVTWASSDMTCRHMSCGVFGRSLCLFAAQKCIVDAQRAARSAHRRIGP